MLLLLLHTPVPLPRLWRARIGRQLWPHLQHRVAAVEAPLLTEEAEEAYQRQEEAGLMSWRQVKAVSSAIHSTPVETSSPEGAPHLCSHADMHTGGFELYCPGKQTEARWAALPPLAVLLCLAVDAQQARKKSRAPLHGRLDVTLPTQRVQVSTGAAHRRAGFNLLLQLPAERLTSTFRCARPPPLKLVGSPTPPLDMVSMETLLPRIAL